MKLSDGDREQLFERLSRHAAAGHLDLDELERRVAVVDGATTREEAAVVVEPTCRRCPAIRTARRVTARDGGGVTVTPTRRRRDWRPTSERFRDPRTNQVMRVWEDAGGGRHYVADDGPLSAPRPEGDVHISRLSGGCRRRRTATGRTGTR